MRFSVCRNLLSLALIMLSAGCVSQQGNATITPGVSIGRLDVSPTATRSSETRVPGAVSGTPGVKPTSTSPHTHTHTNSTPPNQFYVSAVPTGNGWTQAEPMSLQDAIENALPGDVYWLLEGVYQGAVHFQS